MTPDAHPDTLTQLIALAYEAAVDAAREGELCMSLCQHIGADAIQLVDEAASSGELIAVHLHHGPALQPLEEPSLQHWTVKDPFACALRELPEEQVHACQDHVDEEAVKGSAFYQKFLLPHGLRWSLGARLRGSLRATLVIARRSAASGAFDSAAAHALGELLPHLRRAAMLREKAQQEQAAKVAATELLQQFPVGYVVTDQAGRCLECNDAFRSACQRLDIRVWMGRVRFARSEQQQAWEEAVQEIHHTGVERRIPAGQPPGFPCAIRIRPLREARAAQTAGENRLMLAVLEEAEAPTEALRALEGRLTPAEIQILASLLTGAPAKTIAVQRGASVNTVRYQIMAILEKTGFRSQRELIASLGGHAASGFVVSAFGHSSHLRGSRPS